MRIFWNFIVALLIVSFIFYVAVGITVVDYAKDKRTEVKTCQTLIGEQILLNTDTLTIYDYSWLTNTYTLSNGTKVHENIVNKNLLKDSDEYGYYK